ncbi:uncharacterized protein LOC129595897 [Paramacrobiotus metropolitanus]|uniref:uncharacterized protein LOC129595897 n=1 Tax=Paramacrobiotus metropolitanus TaxID=2943436 RepID=UPI0024459D72|nr:uncharacterized protein LOC129595897 [Paramacrobiotus metropolitanus]
MHWFTVLTVICFSCLVAVSARPNGLYGSEEYLDDGEEDLNVSVQAKRGGWNSWGWGPGAAGKRSGPIRRYPTSGLQLNNLAATDPCTAWKYLALNPDAFVRRTELIALAQCLQWKV